jgi:hypothetical protein
VKKRRNWGEISHPSHYPHFNVLFYSSHYSIFTMGNLSSDCVDPSMNGRHRKESLVFIKPENDGMANQSTNQIPSSFQSLLDLYRNHQNRSPFGDESNVLSTPVKNHDYRGFCFMIHPKHGILLLQCSKLKKNKPSPHFQVPGGHIDNFEFHQQQHLINYPLQQLYAASRCGCAREVFEETGIDLRHDLHRFKPVFLNINETRAKGVLCNDYKHRLFFIVILTDSDFRVCIRSTQFGS